jgi:hypothetical protein
MPSRNCGKKVRLKPTKTSQPEVLPQNCEYIRPVIFGHQ